MHVDPPSPFYRVAAKALIFDDDRQLLVLQNRHGEWELPGGGWEHDESFNDCIRREIYEELCEKVTYIGEPLFMYRGRSQRHRYMALRIAVVVSIEDDDFIVGEDMQNARYVDQGTFMSLDFTPAEGNIADFADKIWPVVTSS